MPFDMTNGGENNGSGWGGCPRCNGSGVDAQYVPYLRFNGPTNSAVLMAKACDCTGRHSCEICADTGRTHMLAYMQCELLEPKITYSQWSPSCKQFYIARQNAKSKVNGMHG